MFIHKGIHTVINMSVDSTHKCLYKWKFLRRWRRRCGINFFFLSSMNRKLVLFTVLSIFFCSVALAQDELPKEGFNILAIVKDSQNALLEGYVRDRPDDATVSSKDNREKKVPSRFIKSITLEKNTDLGMARLDPGRDVRYSVRLENDQEIYTLRKKYTFSLNTNVGVVTRIIDPEMIHAIVSKELTTAKQKSADDKSLIVDQSVIFSLEFKF